MFRFLTAGESHGPSLTAIIEGIPGNLPINKQDIDHELRRRQLGLGRGGRMKIERDAVEITSGVRFERTMGAPITLVIANKDWKNWRNVMTAGAAEGKVEKVTRPRPGHADLTGALKYDQDDLRNVLERASARETAARVAVGAVAKRLLLELGVVIGSHVVAIGRIAVEPPQPKPEDQDRVDRSPVRCLDDKAAQKMVEEIEQAEAGGDTLGGVFEVIAWGVPAGLGSYTQWDARLDGRLAQALMSIPAIKGVQVGAGFGAAAARGSAFQDAILLKPGKGFARASNRAGGLEAGMTNGEPVVLRAAMKPIPTVSTPLRTIDIATGGPAQAHKERHDTCAVPSAAVVGEAVVAIELASAVLQKFASDSLADLLASFQSYLHRIR